MTGEGAFPAAKASRKPSGTAVTEPAFLEFLCGGCSALTSIFVAFPLHKTIFVQQLEGVRWMSAAYQVFHQRPTLIFRGVLPPLCQKTASLSIMFGAYGQTRRFLRERNPETNDRALKAASALFAGCCEATLCPFERVQTLLQNSNFHHQFRNTFHTSAELWRTYGLSEFYRGFLPILIRNGSSNVVYFLIRDRFLLHNEVTGEESHSGPVRNFVGGALLGAGLGAATYPLNVAKTRIQTQVGGQSVSFITAIAAVYRERDRKLTLFYRGVLINCLRSMISWGIITMSHDWFRAVFVPVFTDRT